MTEYQKIEKKVGFFLGKPVSLGVYGLWLVARHGYRAAVRCGSWCHRQWFLFKNPA